MKRNSVQDSQQIVRSNQQDRQRNNSNEQDEDEFKYSDTYPRNHILAKFRRLLFEELGGGEKKYWVHYFINLHKGLTCIAIVSMMIIYNNFSSQAFAYLSLHGTYGIVWLIKDRICPDKVFHQRCTLLSGLCGFIVLNCYWYPGWIIISNNNETHISNLRIYVCTMLFFLGELLMIGSDVQKYFTLKIRKALITDGFFAMCRSPNFLGEILVYAAFAALSASWKGWIPYFFFISVFLPPPIILKDISLRRKEGGEKYFQQSYLLLFKFFSSDLMNVILYLIVFMISIYIYLYL